MRPFVRAARPWLAGAAPAVLGVLPVLLVLTVAVAQVHRQGIHHGDFALIELWTRSAWSGDALVGPYSRFGWNHPGPLVFYWFAPFYAAFDRAPESLGVAAAAFNALALGSIVVACRRASGPRAGWVAACTLVLLVQVWSYSFIDRIWNPFIVLGAIMASGALAAAAISGRRWALPWFALLASFATQTHVGTAPVVGLFGLAAAGQVVWSARGDRREAWASWWRPLGTAVAVAAVVWAPAIYEQLTRHPGNVGQLVQFFTARRSGHGLGDALDLQVVQLTGTKRNLISSIVSATKPVPAATGPRLVVLALLLGVCLGGVVVNARRGRRFEQQLCLMALLAALGAVVGAMRVAGALEGYLTLPAAAAGGLLWLATMLTVTAELERAQRAWMRPWPGRASIVVAVAAILWLTHGMALRDPATSLQVRQTPDHQADLVLSTVMDSLPPGEPFRLELGSAGDVGAAATLVNQLELQGHRPQVSERWTYFFGDDHLSDGCERARVIVAANAPPEVTLRYRGSGVSVSAIDPPPACTTSG